MSCLFNFFKTLISQKPLNSEQPPPMFDWTLFLDLQNKQTKTRNLKVAQWGEREWDQK